MDSDSSNEEAEE